MDEEGNKPEDHLLQLRHCMVLVFLKLASGLSSSTLNPLGQRHPSILVWERKASKRVNELTGSPLCPGTPLQSNEFSPTNGNHL